MLLTLPLLLAACGTVPITGRSTLQLIPEYQMHQQARQNYAAFLSRARR